MRFGLDFAEAVDEDLVKPAEPEKEQVKEPKDILNITPHYPIQKYNVEGYPLSSLEAFILYANGADIYSLITENKTIVGAINELKKLFDNIDLSQYVTRDELDAYAKLEDLLKYATKEELKQLQVKLTNLTTIVNNHTTQIEDIQKIINDILSQLPPGILTFVLASNTNPRYFATTVSPVHVSPYNFNVTQEGEVIQDIVLADGILEILNLTFADNVTLCNDAGTPIDSTMTPHFYIPMTVDYYNSSNEYTGSDNFMLDGQWSREMGAYDFSIYFRGEITIPEGGRAHYKFSANVPLNIQKGVQNETI